jgi:hypothetical protein
MEMEGLGIGGMGLDQVVHINNGSDAARPIILRLLPGEETIFELKVVNHGEPSDITLEASDPVFKAVRFRRPDNHVTKEVIIPIMARMPANKKRLDGEILLTSNAGESRVPISLLRDSEDADRDGEEDQRVDAYDVEDDDSDAYYNADDDADDKPVRKSERYGDDAEDDEDAEEGDDFDAVEKVRYLDAEEAGKEPRRIVFSRDRDLERYRSASRQKAEDDPDEVAESVRSQRRTKIIIARGIGRDMEDGIGERTDEDIEDNIGNRPDSHITPRFNSRIDDRFVEDGQRFPQDLPVDYQDFPSESDSEGSGGKNGREESGGRKERDVREIPYPSESDQGAAVADEGYLDQDSHDYEPDKFSIFGLVQIIPIAIFLALLIVLVLTFITFTIPEFPGAVASSILIVTLIIYGAATLLKA